MSRFPGFQVDGKDLEIEFEDKYANLYLTCSTARNVVAKVVTCEGFILTTGLRVAIRFTDTGKSNPEKGNITLNINNTGAKQIVLGNSNRSAVTYQYGSDFYNNKVQVFMYDGENWVFINRDTTSADLTGEDVNNILLVTSDEM